MKIFFIKLFKKIGNLFWSISNRLEDQNNKENVQVEDIQAIRCKPWFRDKGDQTLRLDYQLDSNSVVVDLGGYEGQWAADIFCKYGSTVWIFEPYQLYFENIVKKFSHNPKVKVFNYGLSKSNEELTLYIKDNSSSVFSKSPDEEKSNTANIKLIKASDFLNQNNVSKIDLLKINIEGGEYDLLEHLIETNFVRHIDNIQVQFHDFVENADARMKKIQGHLKETHYTTYQYEFVWENWKLKNRNI